ncbi:MAG: gliding motility-associated C-terminal domain-containing protein [Bacteroidota bacterium]|nr:gliding motility-associated C-terminal domain-containing protein [Bacteroidota bacterium]
MNVYSISCRVESPNIFTPNNDGTNDYFSFIGQNLRSVNCEIFNRYGTLVYKWDDPDGRWDGTNIQTRQPVSEGVYYFVAHIENYEGKPVEVKGFIQLVR